MTEEGGKCFVITVLVTALAWNAAPLAQTWFAKIFTPEGFAALAAITVLLVIWPPGRALVASVIKPKWAIVPCVLGVSFVAGASSELPGFMQICIGAILLIPVGFLGLWPIMKPQFSEGYPRPAPEELRRYPLIRGLMQAVMAGTSNFSGTSGCNIQTSQRIGRIALTGPWGCGKTLILDHVAYSLEKLGLARAVKVSPWACSTIAEARASLACGIRLLLSEPGHRDVPVLKVLGKFFGLSDSVEMVFNEVVGSRSAGLQDLDSLLEQRERKTGLRMMLIIDDMERSEPHIIRGLLPLLSELIELKHCTFLVAIDEQKLRAAFVENGYTFGSTARDPESVASTAEGFLNKIFDFRIEMPSRAPRDRVAALARLKLGVAAPGDSLDQPHQSKLFKPAICDYPKLRASLDHLYPYLPMNPRDLERFLDKARLYEACFLSSYQDEERDWLKFFELHLLDVRFPGLATAISRSQVNYAADSFDQVISKLKSHGLDSALDESFQSSFKAYMGPSIILAPDLHWIAGGFMNPPFLPGKLRAALIERWRSSEPCSFEALVKAAFTDTECPEIFGVVTDLVKFLYNYPFSKLREIDPLGPLDEVRTRALEEVHEHLQKTAGYLDAWKAQVKDSDILANVLAKRDICEWLHLANLIEHRALGVSLATLSADITLRFLDFSGPAEHEAILEDCPSSADRELTKTLLTRCKERVRKEVWLTIRSANQSSFWPFNTRDASQALMQPSLYFPEGSPELHEMQETLHSPPRFLADGINRLWSNLAQWLPRWNTNENQDLEQFPNYWLILWDAFERSSPSQVAKIGEALLKSPKLAMGLSLVRKKITKFPKDDVEFPQES